MSDHRVSTLERKVDELMTREADLYRQVGQLKAELRREMRMAINALRSELRAGQADTAELGREMRAGQATLRRQMQAADDDQERLMRTLHEDVLDKIRFLAPDLDPIRREFKRELREEIERHS